MLSLRHLGLLVLITWGLAWANTSTALAEPYGDLAKTDPKSQVEFKIKSHSNVVTARFLPGARKQTLNRKQWFTLECDSVSETDSLGEEKWDPRKRTIRAVITPDTSGLVTLDQVVRTCTLRKHHWKRMDDFPTMKRIARVQFIAPKASDAVYEKMRTIVDRLRTDEFLRGSENEFCQIAVPQQRTLCVQDVLDIRNEVAKDPKWIAKWLKELSREQVATAGTFRRGVGAIRVWDPQNRYESHYVFVQQDDGAMLHFMYYNPDVPLIG